LFHDFEKLGSLFPALNILQYHLSNLFVDLFPIQLFTVARGHGPLLIRKNLLEKGIADDLSGEKMEECASLVPETIANIMRKRDPEGRRFSDYSFHAKQVRYLAGKGFSYDDISSCLGNKEE